jgi:arginase
MSQTIGYLGVPTAAGAHSPGNEKAPAALRAAGLVESLHHAGALVHDWGDLPPVPFALDRQHRRAQNAAKVGEVARHVADKVQEILARRELPLIIGGDCTILAGVISGFLSHGADPGLVYFDAHPDLNTPTSIVQGALDWMGMGHILALPGAAPELRDIGPRTPLLRPEAVVFFSYIPSELTPGEIDYLAAHRPAAFPAEEVSRRAPEAAQEAADLLRTRRSSFVVHFDVDALDFVDFPIADNAYQRNQGLTLASALRALGRFAACPGFAGLVVSQVNPDHAAGQGDLIGDFARRLAEALAAAQVTAAEQTAAAS